MRAVDIDFVRRARRPSRVVDLAAVGLVVVAFASGADAFRLRNEADDLRSVLAATQARLASNVAASGPPLAVAVSADAATPMRPTDTPWPEWLAALETVRVAGVRLAVAELRVDASLARVQLEAAGSAVLLAYVDQLNAGHEQPMQWSIERVSPGDRAGAVRAVIVGGLPAR